MREIKFRAWDEVLGEMIYSKIEQFDDSWMFRFEKHFETETPIYLQYTGLKDKNGKEIYEGDTIKITHEDGESENYTVKYMAYNGYPAFDTVPSIDCDSNGLSHAMACCEIEVIGNIHETPDLVKS